MNVASITRLANKARVKAKKNAPQILFVAGMVGSVSTVVMAARAGAKTAPVIDQLAENRDFLERALAAEAVEKDVYDLGVKQEYTKAVVELTKLYAPVAVVGVVSVVCLTRSHQILSNRNAALTVAFTTLDKAMKDYRARVVADQGEQKDLEYLHGTVEREVSKTNSKGETKTKIVKELDTSNEGLYSYYFDESHPCWEKDPGYNHTWLSNQQKWANLKLQRQGHLFLNEVYDMLRIPHTPMGQFVGWIYHPEDTDGDGFVDFGYNKYGEFVAGMQPSVMLEFNVDGNILEKI